MLVLLLIGLLVPANIWLGAKVVKRLSGTSPSVLPRSPSYEARVAMLTGLAEMQDVEIVFAGDSLTYHCPLAELLPFMDVQNSGVLSDTATGLARRWESTVAAFHPETVFVLIGINDILAGLDTDIAEVIGPLLKSMPPETVYVQSILPVAAPHAGLNGRIRSANEALKKMAEESGQHFLDIHAALADSSGVLRREYTYDGLHLTLAGYLAWKAAIRNILAR